MVRSASFGSALGVLACFACGGSEPAPARETPAPPAHASAQTSGPAPGAAPVPQGAVRIRIGEAQQAFEPNMPDSRFEQGTTGMRLYVYGPDGWSAGMDVPADYSTSNAHFEAEALRVWVSIDGTENAPVNGVVDFDELDPATGRVALTVRGSASAGPVEVDLDTQLTPAAP